MRQLSEDDRTEHQYAAQDLASAQTLSQDQPSGNHRDTGFETEDQRGYGRIHVFLTDDLKSVGNTAGQDSGIEERNFGSKNATEIRTLKKQCRNSGEDAADKELYAGHFYSVHQRGEMIDDQNMQRKKYCTDQDEQFSLSDGEALTWCQAEKIQSTQGKNYRDPDEGTAFSLQKDPEYGNNDDVTGSDKTGFSNGGIFDSKLLKIACKAEQNTTADTADE